MTKNITNDDNVIDIDFEKKKIQNDIDDYKNTRKLPITLTSRKFLIKYNSIYECLMAWSQLLELQGDPVWSELTDDYIEYARQSEIAAAADVFKQLDREVKNFFKNMGCRTYKFLTTTIKGDPVYKSHIFSLARELEFITPKIKYGFELTKTEKFKVSLFVNHQREVLDNVNEDLRKINDIIIRYKSFSYLTWSEPMYQSLQLRSNLDHVLQVYIASGEAINAVIPYTIK